MPRMSTRRIRTMERRSANQRTKRRRRKKTRSRVLKDVVCMLWWTLGRRHAPMHETERGVAVDPAGPGVALDLSGLANGMSDLKKALGATSYVLVKNELDAEPSLLRDGEARRRG